MTDGLWQEVALMSISKEGGDEIQFDVITETIDFGLAERGVESAKLINGGRLMLWSPEEDTEISFECYPREVGTSTGNLAKGVWDLKYTTTTTSDVTTATPDLNRDLHRISFLWTQDSAVTDASDATSASNAAKRFSFADAYVTNVEPDFSEKHLKYTVTMKIPVRDQSANPNMLFESVTSQATSGLTALSPYTSTTKFR